MANTSPCDCLIEKYKIPNLKNNKSSCLVGEGSLSHGSWHCLWAGAAGAVGLHHELRHLRRAKGTGQLAWSSAGGAAKPSSRRGSPPSVHRLLMWKEYFKALLANLQPFPHLHSETCQFLEFLLQADRWGPRF